MANHCQCQCGAAIVVRTFHTLLVLGVAGSLMYYKKSLLYQCLVEFQNVPLGLAYICVLLWSLVMYFITCLTDPGYVLPSDRKKKIKPTINRDDDDSNDDEENGVSRLPDSYLGNDEGEEEDAACNQMLPPPPSSGVSYRVCDYCEINQPMRTKHCEDCNRCVRKFDHHCPWLEACIGEHNHRYFWLFLFSTFTLVSSTLYITWEAFEYRVEWTVWLRLNWILCLDMIILVLGALVTAGLMGFHSYLMIMGVTTWEAASRERIPYLKYLDEDFNPFDEGLCRNLRYFMCSRRHRKWEKVYAHKARGVNGIV